MSQRATWERGWKVVYQTLKNHWWNITRNWNELEENVQLPAKLRLTKTSEYMKVPIYNSFIGERGGGWLSTLNTQSLIHGLSHQLSLFCSVFFYDFTKIVFRIREVIENTMYKDFFQGLFRVESLNWQAMVTLLLDQASQLVRALGLTSSPLTHTLARSAWIHFEHSPVRSWSLPSPLPKCELTGAPAPVEAAQVCLRVPHFAPHSVPHTRLEICQKNYTTGFLGQKIYTLKETA